MPVSCKIANRTLNTLDELKQFKIEVLKKIHSQHLSSTIRFDKLHNQYFPKKKKSLKIRRQYTKKLTSKNRCRANIWSKEGPIQCMHGKKIGNYCKRHYYKRYYGDVNNNHEPTSLECTSN